MYLGLSCILLYSVLFYFFPDYILLYSILSPLQSQEAQVLRALAEKREHERDVVMKAMEENSNFSKMAEEKLTMKMEQIKENRQAYLASIMERLQEKVRIEFGGKEGRWRQQDQGNGQGVCKVEGFDIFG